MSQHKLNLKIKKVSTANYQSFCNAINKIESKLKAGEKMVVTQRHFAIVSIIT